MKIVKEEIMPMIVVVGAQWGDEGKGKVVDFLTTRADVVARFGGGANAGHTVWVDGNEFVTHLLPSGILQGKICVLGAGMVIDPRQLLAEINDFAQKGIDVSYGQIRVSPQAHMVLPTHQELDAAYEKAKGKGALGTTKRGIGPAYVDKAMRNGLRFGDMEPKKEEAVKSRDFYLAICERVAQHNRVLAMLGWGKKLGAKEVAEQYTNLAYQLTDYVQDTSFFLRQLLKTGHTVVVEGAQGTLLDIDHGGYPFVTSSSTLAGAAAASLGVGPTMITDVVGVAKCFQTRVGEGPMPTEIGQEERKKWQPELTERERQIAQHLRGVKGEPGAEFGSTTGRMRRVGWLDLPLLRYACGVNGITQLVLTKLDVLSGLESLKICVAYRDGAVHYPNITDDMISDLGRFAPEYEDIVGWHEKIGQVCNFDDLPELAKRYVKKVEQLAETKVSMVSVGTDRSQIIVR